MVKRDDHDTDYRGPERRSPDRWRFKREISWGDITIAIGMVGAAFFWGKGIEQRIAQVETAIVMQSRIDQKQDELVRDSVSRIESGIRDIQQWIINRPK